MGLSRNDIVDYLAWIIQTMNTEYCCKLLIATRHIAQAIRVAARGRGPLSEHETHSICESIIDARDAIARTKATQARIALEELYRELNCDRLLAGPAAGELEEAAKVLRETGQVELDI